MEQQNQYYIAVTFETTNKEYYFSTILNDLKIGDYVVVETTYVNGLTKSSADMRPVIKHIDEKMNFREEAARTILARRAEQIRLEQ